MVQICALASGSNGNCYYIGNDEEAVLIDIGISNKQLIQRLDAAGLSLRKIKALFVTHEHTDHMKGMRVVSDKNNIEAYATHETWEKGRKDFRSTNANCFSPGDTLSVGSIKVHSFSKQHDAIDPVSFRVEIDGLNIAVLTDLGVADDEIKEQLKLCDAAFLECNYEPHILETGRYPVFLKQRVASDIGHLSNHQAFDLVKSLNGSPLKTIFLSHISKDNNTLELALEAFKPLENNIQIEATSRETISRVIEI